MCSLFNRLLDCIAAVVLGILIIICFFSLEISLDFHALPVLIRVVSSLPYLLPFPVPPHVLIIFFWASCLDNTFDFRKALINPRLETIQLCTLFKVKSGTEGTSCFSVTGLKQPTTSYQVKSTCNTGNKV